MMKGKKGTAGEGIITIYRLVLTSVIALVIFGVYSVFYVHIIDVRDAEARILSKDVMECLAPKGLVDYNSLSKYSGGKLLSSCGYVVGTDRVYVKANLRDETNNENNNKELSHGDSGLLWIKDFFDSTRVQGSIEKYKPGYYIFEYPVMIKKDSSQFNGYLKTEVLVNEEK